MLNETGFRLRPMRLAELLDAAFRLYRRNFWVYVGIVALVQIPVSLLSLVPNALLLRSVDAMAIGELSLEYFAGMGLTFMLSLLQFFLISGLATLALTRALVSAVVGEKIGVFDAFQQAWPRLGRFLVTLFLLGLLMVGLYIWMLVPCVGWISGPGILMMVASAVLPFAAPVALLERHSASGTISRTWDLVRRRFWWVLALAGSLFLLNLVLVGPAAFLNLFLSSSSPAFVNTEDLTNQAMLNTVIQTLVGMLTSVLYLPLQFAVVVLAYFDLRVRTEGIDLFIAANTSEGQAFTLAQLAEMPPVTFSQQIVTGTEIGNFILLTVAVVVLYLLLFGAILLISAGRLMGL